MEQPRPSSTATGPALCSQGAAATEALAPQRLCPAAREARAAQLESALLCTARDSPRAAAKTPHSPGEGHSNPPVLLPGEPQGQGGPVGSHLWVTQTQTRLSDFTFTFHFHVLEKEMVTRSSVTAWRTPGTGGLVGSYLWVAQRRTRVKQVGSSIYIYVLKSGRNV